MVSFRYSAKDATGQETTGHIEAADADDARHLLHQQGLSEVTATASEIPSQPTPEALSDGEAIQVTQQVAELSAANLPLGPGLLAAADECAHRRVAQALRSLGTQLEAGRSLEDVVQHADNILPGYLRGLILAAAHTGKLAEALSELVEHQRAMRRLRRKVAAAFIYPLLVAFIATVLLVCILVFVGGAFLNMLLEFEMQLPLISAVLFWWRDTGLFVMAGCAVLLMLFVVFMRLQGGRAGWQRFLASVPLFGKLSLWSGIAEWCSLLAVLFRYQVSLLDALRLSATGVRNAHVGQISSRLAEGAARGRSLSEMLVTIRVMPATLTPIVRWGEKSGTMPEALAVGREMFINQVQGRALLLQTFLPPMLFVVIGCGVLFVVGGLFMPLLSLLQGLS